MAIFPCDVGNHPHPRKNILVYASTLTRDGDLRSRVRLCQLHWNTVQPYLTKFEVTEDVASAGDAWLDGPCPSCDQPLVEPIAQVFITSYPTKDDRKDYWLRIHEPCGTPGWLPWKPQPQ